MAAAILLIVLTGCGRKRTVRAPIAPMPKIGDTENGIASWYGNPYHGRRAANGEIYDMEKMTAAHRTLPFETVVRVQNQKNRRTVDVRITDRGPFINGRIIDLSRAAARQIEMIGPGIVPVRVWVIGLPPSSPARTFAVQVGAFRTRFPAEKLKREMERRYGHARVVRRRGGENYWRVVVGRGMTEADAKRLSGKLEKEVGNAFVIRLEAIS
jgi:rare lipoprotein A